MPDSRNNFAIFRPLIILLLVIWCFQLFNFATNYSLNGWLGLSTRRSSGLPGILFCPFLHGSFQHAALNSAPLALMGGIIIGIDRSKFLPATAIITIIGGSLTWLLSRPNTIHVGASGVVFGYLGFLVAYGIRTRSVAAILGAVFAVVAYGYLIEGLVPAGPGVSWEGHLFGLIGGVAAAFILPNSRP